MDKSLIQIFRGDDTDGLGYQSIQGKITTTLDLTGCRAIFRYLGFTQEFDPIPENGRITITIPASVTSRFPPGLGYASLRVYDSNNKVRTFTNRIPVFVTVYAPSECGGEFEVVFNGGNLELEPLKIKSVNGYRIYDGYLEQIIDKATAIEYGLALLFDSGDSAKGANSGYAATPKAVQAAYDAIIQELTDNYYNAEETDEAIDRIAAYYITADAQGNPFATHAALMSATAYYSGGQLRTPTRNDYCVVLADETHGGKQYRYIYAVNQQGVGQWEAQYAVGGSIELDNTVTRTSTNGVKSSGIWSAIWGALTALPGVSSLYDWCVAQLAGKASTADVTLTPIYSNTPTFSEWTFSGTSPSSGHHWEVTWDFVSQEYRLYDVPDGQTWESVVGPSEFVINIDGTLTTVVFPTVGVTATRTRTDLIGYQLGSQSDKPLQPKGDYASVSDLTAKADVDYVWRNFANLQIIAWAYSSANTYNKGDYCIHDWGTTVNALCRCKVDNTTGAWYSENWDIVRLANEVVLKSIHSETPEFGAWTISQNPNYGVPIYGLYYAPIGSEYEEAGLPSADTEVWWFDMTGTQGGIWTTETSPSATSVSCTMPLEFPDHTENITLTGTRTVTYPVIAYQLGNNSDKLLQPKGDYALLSDLAGKAPLASPAFTGTPTAPTPASGDNSTKVATTAFVKTAISGISITPLSGQTFNFATTQGVMDALKTVIEALGGTVINAPTLPAQNNQTQGE